MRTLRFGLILCLALLAHWGLAQAPHLENRKPVTIQPEAWEIVVLANQARATQGAKPLQWDTALGEAARQHCLRMAAEGPISHRYGGEPDLSERASQAGAHFSLIEENVAVGPTPAGIHELWMHSPGHRTNLLNPDVDRVGVAVVASRGVLYAVADYARVVSVLSQTQVESTIAELVRAKGVAVLNDAANARSYCAQEQVARDSKLPGFRMLWQEADLTHLPQALLDRIGSGHYHRAAVGSCPAQDVQGSFTAYRVAVLLY